MSTMDNVWVGESSAKRKDKSAAKKKDETPVEVAMMIQGLKKVYKEKILPFEQKYDFADFTSSSLTTAWFDAKPFVLLAGQYSVGKTTFIRYLLERDFPSARIGPEPTTDKFHAIMHGPQDRIIPGNALAADPSKPFTQLTQFGMGFLNRFECTECASPILEKISLIDSPGVLSGEKQRANRGYDFPKMCEWFAGRADRILLLFDAHKLDISDEFRDTIVALRPHDDKIRVILNKADVPQQQLMRVYGALMWSMGKVMNTPEVLRVYVGSFWDQPLKHQENRALLEMEEKDLLADLRSLPRNVAVRRLNEIIIRARKAKVHGLILSHLKDQFGMFGKEKTQRKLIEKMGEQFGEIATKHKLPKSDFPKLSEFKTELAKKEVFKYPKVKKEYIATIDEVISVDLPKLMGLIPSELEADEESADTLANPFETHSDRADVVMSWAIDGPTKQNYDVEFHKLPATAGRVSGKDMRSVMVASGLPTGVLRELWELSDIDKDGWLDSDEFAVCKFLIESMKAGKIDKLPAALPDRVIPPTKRHLFDMGK